MTTRSSARRYARALFDVARAEDRDVDAIGAELTGVARLIEGNEPLQRALSNPAIPPARKRAVIEELLRRSPVSDMLARLLLLLADRDRLVVMGELAEAYRERLLDHHQVVRAEIATAMPLSEDRVQALQQGLARVTGRHVKLDVREDPALVGGAVARIGSTVWDGSLATQLEKLREQLVDAAV